MFPDEQRTEKTQWFTTTHWSVVLSAGRSDSPHAADALEKLCRAYWNPLYAYVRRQGEDEQSAQDLTQGFFERFLEKNYLAQVQREKGKFRCFLLASLKHFLADEWDKARAQKRGGAVSTVALDAQINDEHPQSEPADPLSPDRLYDRHWADSLLLQALHALEQEMSDAGQARAFDALVDFLRVKMPGPSHAEVAKQLGTTTGTVRNAVQRLRDRYGELIRTEIAKTLANPTRTAVDEELSCLFQALE